MSTEEVMLRTYVLALNLSPLCLSNKRTSPSSSCGSLSNTLKWTQLVSSYHINCCFTLQTVPTRAAVSSLQTSAEGGGCTQLQQWQCTTRP